MSELFPHMIPATPEGRSLTKSLAGMFDTRPGQMVELILDWAIPRRPEADPSFSPSLQFHVHLSKNYRRDIEPTTLGQYLHLGLRHYVGRQSDGFRDSLSVRYYGLDVPEDTRREIQRRAFAEGIDPRTAMVTEMTDALRSLLTDPALPPAPRSPLLVPMSAPLRGLYDEVAKRASKMGWDADSVIAKRIAENVARPRG